MSNATAKLVHQEDALVQAAFQLGKELRQAETAIDGAIASVAKAMARVPDATSKAALSAIADQHVFNHMGSSISSLTASRSELVKAHRVLETLRVHLNLPEVSWGDKGPSPHISPVEATGARLRAIGEQA